MVIANRDIFVLYLTQNVTEMNQKMCIISSWMPSYFESQIIELKQRNNWPQQKSTLETEESLANSPATVIGLLSVHCLSVKALYKVLNLLSGFQRPSK